MDKTTIKNLEKIMTNNVKNELERQVIINDLKKTGFDFKFDKNGNIIYLDIIKGDK